MKKILSAFTALLGVLGACHFACDMIEAPTLETLFCFAMLTTLSGAVTILSIKELKEGDWQ